MPAYTRILLAQKEEKREGEKEGKIDPNFIILQLNDSIFSLAERIRNAWLPSKKFNILLANLAKTLEGDDQARQEAITNINDLLAEKDQELKKMRPYLKPVLWSLLALSCFVLTGFLFMTLNPVAISAAVFALTTTLALGAGLLCATQAIETLNHNMYLRNGYTSFFQDAKDVREKLKDKEYTPQAMETFQGLVTPAAAV
jgi:hypothetical protein